MNARKTILATTIASLFFVSGLARAEQSPKEEGAGFGLGAIIGGLAGGPVGLALGATIGAVVGNKVAKAKEVEPLKLELSEVQNSRHGLQQELLLVRDELREQALLAQELRERQERLAGLRLQVHFTTGNAQLGEETMDRMIELASVLSASPDMVLEIDGYADQRGDETYNLELSRDRADAVATALSGYGVDPSQMVIRAHGELGEPNPTVADVQGAISDENKQQAHPDRLAFSRRVTLQFSTVSDGQVAENR